jgi:hypothetical protein
MFDPMAAGWEYTINAISSALHRDPFPIHPDDVHIDEATIPGMGVGQED